MRKTIAATIAALVGLTASSAMAATTVYTDVASFNAALPGGTSTLETFDSATPGVFTEGVETNFDGFAVKFNNVANGNQRAGIYTAAQVNGASGTALNGSNSLAWGEYTPSGVFQGGGDGPNVTFRFFKPITAFAFDFSDSDWSDSYSVKIGNEAPFALAHGSSSQFQTFFGLVSDTAFTSIVFSQTATGGVTETFSVDNIRTNGITAPVPVPAGLPLLLTGLGAFGLMRRRQARKG